MSSIEKSSAPRRSEPDGPAVGAGPEFLRLAFHLPALRGDGWRGFLREGLERAFGFKALQEIVTRASGLAEHSRLRKNPFREYLAAGEIETEAADLAARLPKDGPVVLVSNHPFGITEALAVPNEVLKVRSDFQFIGNDLLAQIEALSPWLLPVNIMEAEGATRENQVVLRRAFRHLKEGGMLVVFPAGKVGHWQWSEGEVTDAAWNEALISLGLRAGASFLPVGIPGKSPWWFSLAGLLHPLLRTFLLPKIFQNQRGKRMELQIGQLISENDLAGLTPEAATKLLRTEVMRLARGRLLNSSCC